MKTFLFAMLLAIMLWSCDGIKEKLFNPKIDSTQTETPYTPTKDTTTTNTEESPVINVEPTLVRPQLFLVMKDEATDEKEARNKLKLIFNNLNFILNKYNLYEFGTPIAWHHKMSNVYIEEGGVLVAKKLTYNEPSTYYKQTKRCRVVVAHFFGRRSLLHLAYEAIDKWLAENKIQKAGTDPWEIYVSDPRVMKDKEFLQTDVYVETK